MSASDWCLIESDSGCYTELVRGFGVTNVIVEELYGLSDQNFQSNNINNKIDNISKDNDCDINEEVEQNEENQTTPNEPERTNCEIVTHTPTNRELHNEIERRRRLRIKQCCDVLRTLVPGLSDKTDKATVLEHTVKFVKHLSECPAFKCDCEFWMLERKAE